MSSSQKAKTHSWGCSLMVKCLPSMLEHLSSIQY
jgi:hypothetical protein